MQEQAKQGEFFLPHFFPLNPSLIYFYSNIQNMLTSPNSSTSLSISLEALTRGGWSYIGAFLFLRPFPNIVNFHRTEGYCTQKRGRISPAVQWWFNNHSNYIIRGCTTTCDFSCKDQSDLLFLSRLVGQLVQNCDTWRSFTRPENSINRLKSRM